MKPATCLFDGCGRKPFRRGFCVWHTKQRYLGRPLTPIQTYESNAGGRLCSFEGCDRKSICVGLCNAHSNQKRRGETLRPLRVQNDRWFDDDGYVMIYKPDHPNARKSGSISEHKFVMSEMLGRALLPHENVHHKNGGRADNRPENLELWTRSQPAGQRVVDRVEWAKEILRTYEPEALADDTSARGAA
jgi:hypothetical protein